MKKVDFNKLQAGDLVEVPRTQFAPMRRGWNGWLFSEAVVIRKGVGRKSKKNVVVVEMGYACAVGLVLLIIVMVVNMIQLAATGTFKKEER